MEILGARIFLLMTIALVMYQLPLISSGIVGVNYGMMGTNLPTSADVIGVCWKCGINIVRIYEPNHDVLNALRGKNLMLVIGTRNEDVTNLATNQTAAFEWVHAHIVPYYSDVNIAYITVGHGLVPGDLASFVASAIKNIRQALITASVTKDIQVTTVIAMSALEVSYPPSAGAFKDDAVRAMKDITQVVGSNGATILINVYPYYAYASNPQQISLDYALFLSKVPVVVDGNLNYYNLFDAMVDSFYTALEKIGAGNIKLEISETGWPTKGNEPFTNVQNALTYNRYFLAHVLSGKGTPKRPNVNFNAMLFAMFNEDRNPAGVEQNFGFFYPDLQPVYPFWKCL